MKYLKKNYSNLINFILIVIFVVLINGRPLLGIYLFGYRIGEFLTAFGLLFTFLIFVRNNFFIENLSKSLIITHFLIVSLFISYNIFDNSNFANTYIYKSSVYIWYTAYFYIGFLIFKNKTLDNFHFKLGYCGLFIVFIFNTIYFPNILLEFFSQYSDKFQFLKGSEIVLFFVIVTFFSNRFNQHGIMLDVFLIFSSIFIPLTIFKSRSAGIAIIVFIVVEILIFKKYFLSNFKRLSFIFLICTALFSITSHYLVDNTFSIDETDQAIAQVFKHKYVVSNSYDNENSLFYFYDGRIYSADGNLNWRFQLWQNSIDSLSNNSKFLFGFGYESRLEVFDDLRYSGLDGLNENTHNYFLNIALRGGILGLFLILFFFREVFKLSLNNISRSDLFQFIVPLLFVSMFDGSMENPYFGIIFYIFLSYLLTKNKIYNLTNV